MFIRYCAILLLALLSGFALHGCGREAMSFFPLEKGWRWVYSIDLTTMDGSSNKKYLVENLGRTVLKDEEVSARRTADGTMYYYREDANGVLRIGETLPDEPTRLYSSPIVVLPNPATLSTPSWSNWEYTVALQRAGSPKADALRKIAVQLQMHYVIVSVDNEVVVPAGRFERCLRVRGTGVTDLDLGFHVGPTTIRVESTEWYARGVGLIKAERKETTNSPIIPEGEYRMLLEELQRG